MKKILKIRSGFRICSRCNIEKPDCDFHKDRHLKDGIYRTCKLCKSKEGKQRWKEGRVKRKSPLQQKNYTLKSIYGITLEEYYKLVEGQKGLCLICGSPEIVIDHDHKTGKIRGLLCRCCNYGLGHFRDNIELLEKAIKYLQGEL